MRNKFIYIFILLFTLSSCEDFLVVEADNASTIDVELSTAQDAREFLNGSYDALTFSSSLGGQFALISELMSDGVEDVDLNGDWAAHYNRTTGIFNSSTRSMMSAGYQAVGRANNVLDQLDLISDFSGTEKATIEGEIKFIRAMMHFDLVRFFGQPYGYTGDNSHLGLPIQITQSTDLVNRSSVKAVYDQVIADLKSAIELLPAENSVYANSWAAKGQLAKVYFQMNDFENAFTYANDVIENSPYVFDTDYSLKYGFGESQEVIFGLISTNLNSDNANTGFRDYFKLTNDIPAVYTSSEYANAYALEPSDTRAAQWLISSNGKFICNKFNINEAYTNPVLHITELKLIRGESAAETSNAPQGVADLNDVRERAGLLALSDALAGAPLIQRLREEKRKELYFENNRMHELKRIAIRDTPNLLIRNAPWDCPGMVCQLPDNELKGNPEMESNPQGGCE